MPASKAIRTTLAESGGRCAFPGCEESSDGEDFSGLELVRIRAFRPSEPRYDPSFDAPSLRQPQNLISLCPYHHILIDLDPFEYTADKLLAFKEQYKNRNTKVANDVSSLPLKKEPLPMLAPSWVHPAYAAAAQIWTTERENGKQEEFWQQTLTLHPSYSSRRLELEHVRFSINAMSGGKELTNAGGKLVDFLLAGGNDSIFVEIKKPDTPLLQGSPYRGGVYGPSAELAGRSSKS